MIFFHNMVGKVCPHDTNWASCFLQKNLIYDAVIPTNYRRTDWFIITVPGFCRNEVNKIQLDYFMRSGVWTPTLTVWARQTSFADSRHNFYITNHEQTDLIYDDDVWNIYTQQQTSTNHTSFPFKDCISLHFFIIRKIWFIYMVHIKYFLIKKCTISPRSC